MGIANSHAAVESDVPVPFGQLVRGQSFRRQKLLKAIFSLNLSSLTADKFVCELFQVAQAHRARQIPLIAIKTVARNILKQTCRSNPVRLFRTVHGLPYLFLCLLVECALN